MKNSILVTGGAGFIGFNFIKICLSRGFNIINIDDLKYAANKEQLEYFKKEKNYLFYKLNIKNKNQIIKILKKNKIYRIINFAAESHVDNSINQPKYFYENNLMCFVDFIEALKVYYRDLNKIKKKNFRFIHISTDEVYGSLEMNGKPFRENSLLKPNNPYSSSKAACELVLRSFFNTYKLPYIITNCSNNYGKFQNDEKLIPTIFRNAIKNKDIPIYGKGKNIRDWIFVDDHCEAILKILKSGTNGQKYNIGSSNEILNLDLAYKICKILDNKIPNKKKYKNLIKFVKDRPGHDFRYAINSTKIKKLKWRPKINLDEGLNRIADYYIERYK